MWGVGFQLCFDQQLAQIHLRFLQLWLYLAAIYCFPFRDTTTTIVAYAEECIIQEKLLFTSKLRQWFISEWPTTQASAP